METYIVYCIILVNCFYIYAKLLNLKRAFKHISWNWIFALVLSFFIYYVRLFCHPLAIPIFIVFSLIYITFVTKTEPELSITTTIISFGISFTFYLISSVLTAIIFNGVALSVVTERLAFSCVAILQFMLVRIPWRLKRLKSGMPFLRSEVGGNIGVIISTVLICCYIAINIVSDPNSIYFTIPVIFVFFCGICIFLWWRGRLKKAYIEKLRATEIQSLRDTIQKKDEQVKYLQEHNDYLAKIIHKDNKLIPSMELAVREYLKSFERGNGADIQLKGQLLLDQLETITCERSGVIAEYQSANEKLPLTGVFQIDTLMTYMFNKSIENGIKFGLTISGSVKFMIENIIPVSDLRTLLADLIENAIIATKNCSKREILASLVIFEGDYLIDIFDSGIPFEPETIINFGRKRTTTHTDTGGSGIGLMTVSEILKIYNASFIIEEFSDKYNVFTKKVSVKFDNLNQFIVKAETDEEIRAISVREDIILHI